MPDASFKELFSASDVAHSGRETLVHLAWWRRFDFKIATLVGCTALLIVVMVGVFAYRSIVNARLESFEHRLQSLALALSETIDATALARLPKSADESAPVIAALHGRLQRIVDNQSDIDSIYILQSTEIPGQLRFLIDASKTSRVAHTGELYDATTMPFMLQGFDRVSVEDRAYGDEFGLTQSS
ncbi:MAG: hypothetical protein ABW223_05680, partial [Rariglobus sp.]